MATDIITFNFVQDLFESEDPFPVDFSGAWRWLGYTRKSSAKKMLTTNFEEHEDFCSKWCKREDTSASGFSPYEEIRLTADCFKELGMLAQTPQGRLVRKYYLQCERDAKKAAREQRDRLEELEESKRWWKEYRESILSNPAGFAAVARALAGKAEREQRPINDRGFWGD
jgi:phage anti-repressor protein